MIMSTALLCLASNIYFEARSEPIAGQIAVAEVTLNRVNSQDYPNNICEVVLQENEDSCQFSWWCDGKSDQPKDMFSFLKAKAIAKMMIQDGDYISVVGDEVTHYHSTSVEPYWSEVFQKTQVIGDHVFYRKVISDPVPRPENFAQLICENEVNHVYTMDQCMKVEEE